MFLSSTLLYKKSILFRIATWIILTILALILLWACFILTTRYLLLPGNIRSSTFYPFTPTQESTRLATLPQGKQIDNLTISPNDMHVVYSINSEHGSQMYFDNNPIGQEYLYIADVTFSPDSSKVFFVGEHQIAGRSVMDVVQMNTILGTYDFLTSSITLSADSQHVAYRAVMQGKATVIEDGKVIDDTSSVTTHNGNTLSSLIFSPDGSQLAYQVITNDQYSIAVNGKSISNAYPFAGQPVFSPDSLHVAFPVSLHPGAECIILDGNQQGCYAATGIPVFSPDSTSLSYSASDTTGEFILQGSKKGTSYLTVSTPTLSQDGKHIVYAATKRNNTSIIVLDGKEIHTTVVRTTTDQLAPFIFSTDGKRLAFVAQATRGEYVYNNGITSKTYTATITTPSFSPDSYHLTYAIQTDGTTTIVYDSTTFPISGTIISPPVFLDNTQIRYVERVGSDLWMITQTGRSQTIASSTFTDCGSVSIRLQCNPLSHSCTPSPPLNADANTSEECFASSFSGCKPAELTLDEIYGALHTASVYRIMKDQGTCGITLEMSGNPFNTVDSLVFDECTKAQKTFAGGLTISCKTKSISIPKM